MDKFPHCRSVTVKSSDITDYLNRAAFFRFLLDLGNKFKPQTFISKASGPRVSLTLRKLGEVDEDDEDDPIFGPTGDNLFGNSRGDGFVAEAVITDAGLNRKDFYCMTLENHTKGDLFPYIISLDPSTYKITVSFKCFDAQINLDKLQSFARCSINH
jgi:hypothetical protein